MSAPSQERIEFFYMAAHRRRTVDNSEGNSLPSTKSPLRQGVQCRWNDSRGYWA
ncbi:MAG: hypothetical protein K8963_03360 [Proteobacteria bacterium]|nr:hypothetical protein [Pseudomonadota bacterium]